MIMLKRMIFPLSVALILLFSACAEGKKESNPVESRSKAVISETSKINQIDAKDGAEFISATGPFILDVRTEAEYKTGHLEGAFLLPVQNIQNQLNLIEKYKNKDIFVYCRSGSRSASASKILIDAGFTRVYNLQGGINGWIAAGNPVVK